MRGYMNRYSSDADRLGEHHPYHSGTFRITSSSKGLIVKVPLSGFNGVRNLF